MKTFLLAGVLALGCMTASAQQKIGHINKQELVSSMPEAVKVQADLEQYEKGLDAQFEDMKKEFNTKDSVLAKDSASIMKSNPSLYNIKRDELIGLYQQLANWQEISNKMYEKEYLAKTAPLLKKADDAIKAAAAAGGYGYVLDDSTLLVMPPSDDLLPVVRKNLGIVAPARPAMK